MVSLVVASLAGLLAATPSDSACVLQRVDAQWQGSCPALFGHRRTLTLTPVKAITTGAWRADVAPASAWAGSMSDTGHPDGPIEIETYAGGAGLVRTTYGWFAVSEFRRTGTALQFQIDSSHEVPPTELDRQIVRRADAILSSDPAWNRADTRECHPTDTTWSIYCAMQRATIEVTGGFHHRRPALQVVREIIEVRTAGRPYAHRLRDYNNDPMTRLSDVRTLFAEALAHMNR